MKARAVLMWVALALGGSAGAQETRDWAAALRGDAQAFHDDIAANHAGPVNAADPGFAKRNDDGLALALRRAAHVTEYVGYLYAMRAYAAQFDDGHVAFYTNAKAPLLTVRWPGFLTAYQPDGRQVVRVRADDAPVPIGATLVACDGRAAATLAARNVGDFRGRWSLLSTRVGQGWRVFLDSGNPYVTAPRRCTFRVDGRARQVTLAWRQLADPEYAQRTDPLTRGAPDAIGARTLADGTRWFTLSGFDGNPDGANANALVPTIAAMARDRAAIAAAPRVVLDLRGNNGGSSDWSRQIARVLWGQRAVDASDKAGPDSHVDWRVSPANLASLTEYRDRYAKAPDATPTIRTYFAGAVDGMARARTEGRTLWREPDDLYAEPAATGVSAAATPLRARVFFVTDTGCASACLDAADLWLSLGAVQVGQETSADTLYMDIRDDALPSGVAGAAVPMKVYRGRARGSNVPLRPRYPYPGDIRDTAALERWIATLR